MSNVVQQMKVSDLRFDLRNPRLVEFDLSPTASAPEVIRVLWQAMEVREIALSIAASGFFSHEPVIVANEDGRNVVIEGNRRLAAVQILLAPDLAESLNARLPLITPDAQEALSTIPAVVDTRAGAWRYIGFKHVNGPAKWTSYAKSKYIADVHINYDQSLVDIARQIGDTHKTVQRLYRGLMVIEQAEREGVFSRVDRWKRHFSFSHMYTGVSYPSLATFLSLRPEDEEQRNPVPTTRIKELGELCLWMYGSRRAETPPALKSQNPHLRYLASIVENKDGLAALRSGLDIEAAYELSRPSSAVFEESLLASKRSLQKARGLLSTGYGGSVELLRIAGSVADLAVDLYEEMDRKNRPRRKRRSRGRP